MKHTPGPWTTDPEALTEINGHAHFFIPIVRPVEEGEYEGRGVAVCILPTEDATTEESIIMEANARLIAAAPDLYEALKDLLREAVVLSEDYLETFRDWPDDKTIQGWDKARWKRALAASQKARAALAKVEE